jgi:hypothetical protein
MAHSRRTRGSFSESGDLKSSCDRQVTGLRQWASLNQYSKWSSSNICTIERYMLPIDDSMIGLRRIYSEKTDGMWVSDRTADFRPNSSADSLCSTTEIECISGRWIDFLLEFEPYTKATSTVHHVITKSSRNCTRTIDHESIMGLCCVR